MNFTAPRDNDRQPQGLRRGKPKGRPLPLQALLSELVVGVKQAAEAPAVNSAEWLREGDYLYLEADLPDCPDASMDVCFHDGRAYIRMAR